MFGSEPAIPSNYQGTPQLVLRTTESVSDEALAEENSTANKDDDDDGRDGDSAAKKESNEDDNHADTWEG